MPETQLQFREPRPYVQPEDQVPPGSGHRRATIAVCNRSSPLLDLFTDILADDGFEVVTCIRGERAQHLLTTLQPALVILDFWVGRVSAREIVDRLRANTSTASIPVLLCSADPPTFHQATEWLEESACELLPMPFEIDQLLETARRLTGAPRLVEPLPNACASLTQGYVLPVGMDRAGSELQEPTNSSWATEPLLPQKTPAGGSPTL